MKRIKKITIIVSLLLYTTTNIAQTYYYTTTKTFNQSGYTYQCDVKYQEVTLYNKANILTYTDQYYKSTGKMPSIEEFARIDDVVDDNWTRTKCKKIVNAAFSTTEREKVKGRDFGIFMYISSNTGKVIEVKFNFANFSPFATIPVSVYHNIETELKNNIWFTPTTDGKKLNYICRFWRQEIAAP